MSESEALDRRRALEKYVAEDCRKISERECENAALRSRVAELEAAIREIVKRKVDFHGAICAVNDCEWHAPMHEVDALQAIARAVLREEVKDK